MYMIKQIWEMLHTVTFSSILKALRSPTVNNLFSFV